MRRVFLSSTYKDLTEHRLAVIAAVNGLDGYKCVAMEQFGARDSTAAQFCNDKIAECDVFLGLLGHCYGSIDAESGKSFTELEFEVARQLKKPRLLFLMREDAPVPMHLIEPEKLRNRQRQLRQDHDSRTIRDTFVTPGELAERVTRALMNSDSSSRQNHGLVNPLPPQPSFEHPYPLQENFVGRINERTLLSHWFEDSAHPLLAVTAMGGMGKSALAWAWVQLDVLGLPLPGRGHYEGEESMPARIAAGVRPEGVFWWSFYESESSFTSFLDTALYYASKGEYDSAKSNSDEDKTKALATLLREDRLLVVLDGFERQLTGYSSLNAAYQGDSVRDDDRAFVDPATQRFFRHFLSSVGRSKILITSRLYPIELEGRAGCRREDLTGLFPAEAEAFLRAQGVNGSSVQIRIACEAYGHHPLALRLLAGLIAHDPERPGDIRVAPECDAMDMLVARKHHVLELAYNVLHNEERRLLSQIAAFRFPVTYGTLERTLCPDEGSDARRGGLLRRFKQYYSREKLWHEKKELRGRLRVLLERGLIFFDRERQKYDLHPIVRHYAYDRLVDKEGVHTRLRDYYALMPSEASVEQNSLEKLGPIIELYHHTVRAGLQQEAFNLFIDRLQDPLLKQFCAVEVYASLVNALFSDSDFRPQRLEGKARVMAIRCRAHAFRLVGDPSRAIPLYEHVSETYASEKDIREQAITNLQLGLTHLVLGNLQVAEQTLWMAVHGCREDGGFEYLFLAQEMLAHIYAIEGRAGELRPMIEAIATLPVTFNRAEIRVIECVSAQDLQGALVFARKADEVAEAVGDQLDRLRAKCLIGTILARCACQCKSSSVEMIREAEHVLKQVYERCIAIKLIELEADTLLGLCYSYIAQHEYEAADDSANAALAIAQSAGYRLKAAHAHLARGDIAVAVGDSKAAVTHFTKAKEVAICNGHPHCLTPLMEAADRELRRCGDGQSAIAG